MQTKKKKILFVDDDPNNLLMYSWLLQQSGYEVTRAESAVAALQKIDGNAFDVVVLDYRMPQVDGLQAADEIRGRSPSARIVILTRYEFPEEKSPSFDVVVRKGDGTELLTTLSRLLDL